MGLRLLPDDTSLGERASMLENRAGMQNNSTPQTGSGEEGMTGASVVWGF